MKFLLLTTLVALAAADVSHLLNNQQPAYQYQIPQSSYGVPQASVLGNFDGAGSVQSVSYSNAGAGVAPELTLPSVAGSTLQFNSGFSSPSALSGASSVSGATIQTFENGGFSTPVPLSPEELASYQASTPAPSVGVPSFEASTPSSVGSSSSYQFLSKLSQPSVSTIGFNSARFGSDAALNSGSFGNDGQFNAGFGLGGSTAGFASGGFDSQLNSGLGIGGSQFISKSNGFGGSINDAFGVQTQAAGISEHAQDQLEPEVSKHLYFFDAPEDDEEEEAEAKISLPPVAPKKTYKIIFIKAPSYRNQGTITIPAPPPSEEKTLVYVLVKKPEKNTNVRYQSAVPSKPSKPEVFFIKYKTQKEAEDAVAEIQNKHGATGQVIANLPAGQTIDHIQIPSNIGASSSSSGSFEGQGRQGFGGDSFDTLGAKSVDSSPLSSFGVETRSGAGDVVSQTDSASAPSEHEQVGQSGGSSGQFPAFGQQPESIGQQPGLSSIQGFGGEGVGAGASSHSEASAASSTGDENESQSDVDSGASTQDSDSQSASNSQDDESASKDDGSNSNLPEEKHEESQNGGVQSRTYQDEDSEGEGSNISPFKTYGAPNPSLFKKYGPPDA